MYGSVVSHLASCNVRFPRSDACRPTLWLDALRIRRALLEPFDKTQGRLRELVRLNLILLEG